MVSAGLLMYKKFQDSYHFYLVHPGGPFFQKKDVGYWTIPKGLVNEKEEVLEAAIREFREETGIDPDEPFIPLGEVKQKSGKIVHAWAFEQYKHIDFVHSSNLFKMEWPPRSGKFKEFPEVDKAEFFDMDTAFIKINEAQRVFITRLTEKLDKPVKI